LTLNRTHAAAVLLAALAAAAAATFAIRAQVPGQNTAPAATPAPPASQIPQPPIRPQPARAVIFLDPAHGGPDSGAALGNNVAEKDVALALAARLRTALAAGGFAVITTRDADPAEALTTDQRAEAANRAHAIACIVIHATATGSGVHLYTSTLPPAPPATDADPNAPAPFVPIAWESAQAGYVDQSRRLADLLKATVAKAGVPVLAGQAPLRPLDNLMCPAVAIEIAPGPPDSGATPASDADYQQRVASAVVSALTIWRSQIMPPAGAAQ
jgi:N-acetylmuramoyl-L-alanine amidase